MKKPFIGLSVRLVSAMAVCTALPMLVFFFFFYQYEKQQTLDRYIAQSEGTMEVAISNIEYYIHTSIASTRNVYVNSAALTLLASGSPQDFISSDLAGPQQIFSYLQSIYTVTPDAVQLRLVSYRMNKSFLLVGDTLQKSLQSVGATELSLPSFENPTDVFIEPTHPLTSYGHTLYYTGRQEQGREPTFTIWRPIHNLSFGGDLLGVLAIDMPISLIETNCQPAYRSNEAIYVLDTQGNIIASSQEAESGGILENEALMAFLNGSDAGFSHQHHGRELYLQKDFGAPYLPWKIVKVTTDESVYHSFNTQNRYLLSLFLLGVVVAALCNSLIIFRITRPLKKATKYMRIVKENRESMERLQLSDYVTYHRNDELRLLFRSLEDMMESINRYTIRQYQLKLMNQSAELKMLQAQINPHFVYNTLQCLATNSLVAGGMEQYGFISSFGHMMHYAMDLTHTLVPVKDELDYTVRYFSLQKMRYKSQAEIEVDDKSAKWAKLPKMTLQPIVENSIYHGGVMDKPDGRVTIRLESEQDVLTVQVIDNGVALSDEESRRQKRICRELRDWFVDRYGDGSRNAYYVDETLVESESGAADARPHIGLKNVYMRLFLNFGADCQMNLFSNGLGGTTVQLVIPCP